MRYWHRWKAGYVRLLALQRWQRTHARIWCDDGGGALDCRQHP